jgi:hypothetical protein
MLEEKIEKLIGSAASKKSDNKLNKNLYNRFKDEFYKLDTASNKALFLAMLRYTKAFRDYGDKLVREMTLKDKQVFDRHIGVLLTKLRYELGEKGLPKLKDSIIDVMLFDSNHKDFGILVNLVGETLGNDPKNEILDDSRINLSQQQKDSMNYDNTKRKGKTFN